MGFLPSLVRSSLFGKARKTAQHPILLPWEDIAQCPQFAILKDTVDVVAHPVLDEGCQNGDGIPTLGCQPVSNFSGFLGANPPFDQLLFPEIPYARECTREIACRWGHPNRRER